MTNTNHNVPEVCSIDSSMETDGREKVRETALQHLLRVDRFAERIELHFVEHLTMLPQIEKLVEIEKGCCGFLNFETIGTTVDNVICQSLVVSGNKEAAGALKFFADTAENIANG